MSKISIIPLGGVREFGKNMYAIEINDTIFVLDAGLKYPETEMLGVDFVIPDATYLYEHANQVAGIFLTHGHPDSIGALPYVLAELEVPVFGSQLTVELAKIAVKNYSDTQAFSDFHIVDETTEIDFGDALISFFSTTHTIPDSLGIVLSSPAGSIVYTGDFKFDPAVADGYQTNIARLAEIGSQKVLALLSDSANAMSTQATASESEIKAQIREQIMDWPGRIIVAAVASNLARIQQVLDAAFDSGRYVAFSGQDVDQVIKTARSLGKLQVEEDKWLIPIKQIKNYADEQLLILETGRMGEPLKSVANMAQGRNRQVKIKEGDLVYAVTSPSVAYETFIAKTENLVYRAGGIMRLLAHDLKISGHANRRDLQTMLNILKPQYLIPVQGEYRELEAHTEAALELGMAPEQCFILKRGDKLSYDEKDGFGFEAVIPNEQVLIDGSGVGDIGSIVLRDRKVLSEDGIFIAVITISKQERRIISRAKVHTRGFVYVKTSRDLMRESADKVNHTVEQYLEQPGFDWNDIKNEIRDTLGKFLFEQTKRRPVVLPVVMEVRNPDKKLKKKRPKKQKSE